MGLVPAGAVGVSRPEAAMLADAALLLALAAAEPAPDPAPARPTSVVVTIPPGALTLTATRDGRQVVVTDTRAGELGFSVEAASDRPVRGRVWAAGLPGNAADPAAMDLPCGPVRLTRSGVQVARMPAGSPLGAVRLGVDLRGPARLVWTVL